MGQPNCTLCRQPLHPSTYGLACGHVFDSFCLRKFCSEELSPVKCPNCPYVVNQAVLNDLRTEKRTLRFSCQVNIAAQRDPPLTHVSAVAYNTFDSKIERSRSIPVCELQRSVSQACLLDLELLVRTSNKRATFECWVVDDKTGERVSDSFYDRSVAWDHASSDEEDVIELVELNSDDYKTYQLFEEDSYQRMDDLAAQGVKRVKENVAVVPCSRANLGSRSRTSPGSRTPRCAVRPMARPKSKKVQFQKVAIIDFLRKMKDEAEEKVLRAVKKESDLKIKLDKAKSRTEHLREMYDQALEKYNEMNSDM